MDEPRLLFNGSKIPFTPSQIKIKADWSGSGDKKPHLFIMIFREEKQISKEDIFGAYKGGSKQKEKEYTVVDQVI